MAPPYNLASSSAFENLTAEIKSIFALISLAKALHYAAVIWGDGDGAAGRGWRPAITCRLRSRLKGCTK